MLDIYVSKSLIKSLITLRKRDWNENLNENDIFKKIEEILISDEIINRNENLNFAIIKDQFQGIYIKKKNLVIYFTQMLSFKGAPRSRNTYLSQNFQPAFNYALLMDANISISINPFNLNKILNISAESIVKDFRTLLSMSVIINKSFPIKYNEENIFNNLEDYIISRNKLKLKNRGNNSTYIKIFDEEKNIIVYGKVEGANYSDTINTCRIISKLNSSNYELLFFDLNNDSLKNNNKYNKIIETGFVIIDSTEQENQLQKQLEEVRTEEQYEIILKRNQGLFIKNIIQKYINVESFDLHRCFACDYIIESNFIASHIHRYSDIIKEFLNKKISISSAAHLIVSGENGFLLCPNQDKEFEKGMIYFDYENKKFAINNDKLNLEPYLQLNERMNNQNFSNVNYTDEFRNNVNKHINRINL